MAAKYRSMGQRCNSLALVMLIALAPCFAQGQVQNGMLYSTGNSLYTTDIFELSNGSFVVYKHPYSSMEPSGLLKFNASGQILASYDRTDTYITSVHQIGSGFILLTTDSLNWQGSRRAIILDNNLNLIRSLVPIYAQFPKSFFSYPYILYQFFRILGLNEYCEYFPLLKSEDKLRIQDEIFKKVVDELAKTDTEIKWVFFPTI